jgi:hypothetical protein
MNRFRLCREIRRSVNSYGDPVLVIDSSIAYLSFEQVGRTIE